MEHLILSGEASIKLVPCFTFSRTFSHAYFTVCLSQTWELNITEVVFSLEIKKLQPKKAMGLLTQPLRDKAGTSGAQKHQLPVPKAVAI
jgi:hypothetical protein